MPPRATTRKPPRGASEADPADRRAAPQPRTRTNSTTLLLVLVVLVLRRFDASDAPDGSAAVRDSLEHGHLDWDLDDLGRRYRRCGRRTGLTAGAATSAALGRLVGHTSPASRRSTSSARSAVRRRIPAAARIADVETEDAQRRLHHGHAAQSAHRAVQRDHREVEVAGLVQVAVADGEMHVAAVGRPPGDR